MTAITRKMLRDWGACYSDEQIAALVPDAGLTPRQVLAAPIPAKDRIWALTQVPAPGMPHWIDWRRLYVAIMRALLATPHASGSTPADLTLEMRDVLAAIVDVSALGGALTGLEYAAARGQVRGWLDQCAAADDGGLETPRYLIVWAAYWAFSPGGDWHRCLHALYSADTLLDPTDTLEIVGQSLVDEVPHAQLHRRMRALDRHPSGLE